MKPTINPQDALPNNRAYFFKNKGPKTPLNDLPYDGNTVAAKKKSFHVSPRVNARPPVGGRGIKGYRDAIDRGDSFWAEEGGKVVTRQQAQGRVEVKTGHPNKKVNKYYG